MEFNSKINMVGILAPNDNPKLHGKECVFINSLQSLQFIVKRISRAPQDDSSDLPEMFTGYLDSLEGYADIIDDDMSSRPEQRKEKFIKTFEKRVFVFKGYYDIYNETYKLVKPAEVYTRTEAYNKLGEQYISIPTFQPATQTEQWEKGERIDLKRTFSSYDEFINILKNKNYVGTVEGFQEPIKTPFIIWYDKESVELVALGLFDRCITGDSGYQFIYEYLGKIIISDELKNGIIYPDKFNPTIIYLEEKCYNVLCNRFISRDVDEIIIDSIDESRAKKEMVSAPAEKNITKQVSELSSDKSLDKTLIDRFQALASNNGLFYDIGDVANFHTAVKTRSLVILSGMSGTGKSRLVETYAIALGIKTQQILIIPVRPSWNDDSDLLGYVDLNRMVYRPSETGFVEILRDAAEHKDQLYLVCFDEMNLARVEHYFSQFLSILEKPVTSERKLRIYSDTLKGLYNAKDYPNEINIGDNIIFVGTVNIDESTYHFSDKVLDRSNVIQLKTLNYSTDWNKQNYGPVPALTWTKDEFVRLIKEPTENEFMDYRKCLWEIHTCLQGVNESLGISPRVVKQIEIYICNYPSIEGIVEASVGHSFDIQLVQRVFTKLRGSEDKLQKLFLPTTDKASILEDVFEKYSTLSSFAKSRNVLARKKEELRIYGYCV